MIHLNNFDIVQTWQNEHTHIVWDKLPKAYIMSNALDLSCKLSLLVLANFVFQLVIACSRLNISLRRIWNKHTTKKIYIAEIPISMLSVWQLCPFMLQLYTFTCRLWFKQSFWLLVTQINFVHTSCPWCFQWYIATCKSYLCGCLQKANVASVKVNR